MLSKVNEAIQIGISIMDKYFEKLDSKDIAGDGDADEDEEGMEEDLVIYEVKDPYILRSLPYLIGSPLYIENDHVGLRDDFEEEKVEEVDEQTDEKDENGSQANRVSDDEDEDDEKTDEESEDDLFDEKNKKKDPITSITKNNKNDDDDDNDGDLFNDKSDVNLLIFTLFHQFYLIVCKSLEKRRSV